MLSNPGTHTKISQAMGILLIYRFWLNLSRFKVIFLDFMPWVQKSYYTFSGVQSKFDFKLRFYGKFVVVIELVGVTFTSIILWIASCTALNVLFSESFRMSQTATFCTHSMSTEFFFVRSLCQNDTSSSRTDLI